MISLASSCLNKNLPHLISLQQNILFTNDNNFYLLCLSMLYLFQTSLIYYIFIYKSTGNSLKHKKFKQLENFRLHYNINKKKLKKCIKMI